MFSQNTDVKEVIAEWKDKLFQLCKELNIGLDENAKMALERLLSGSIKEVVGIKRERLKTNHAAIVGKNISEILNRISALEKENLDNTKQEIIRALRAEVYFMKKTREKILSEPSERIDYLFSFIENEE